MNIFKKNLIKKKYKYKLLDDGISKDDISKAKFVLDSKQITMASQTRKFEETFAKKRQHNYEFIMCNFQKLNISLFNGFSILSRVKKPEGLFLTL